MIKTLTLAVASAILLKNATAYNATMAAYYNEGSRGHNPGAAMASRGGDAQFSTDAPQLVTVQNGVIKIKVGLCPPYTDHTKLSLSSAQWNWNWIYNNTLVATLDPDDPDVAVFEIDKYPDSFKIWNRTSVVTTLIEFALYYDDSEEMPIAENIYTGLASSNTNDEGTATCGASQAIYSTEYLYGNRLTAGLDADEYGPFYFGTCDVPRQCQGAAYLIQGNVFDSDIGVHVHRAL